MKCLVLPLPPSILHPLLLLALAYPALAQDAARKPAIPAPTMKSCLSSFDLADGDAVIFLGDSITHQCLYTQYVEDYFYTRQPRTRLHFYNAGVNADFAVDAAMRFDDDVTPFKPKYVTLLFGMNDGAYRPFDQEKFDFYQQNITGLMDRIKALGATPVLMTPTLYDGRANRMRNPDPALAKRDAYYNGVLALYGAWLRQQAEDQGFGFVDLYSPLNNLTSRQRKQNPKWTMTSDAIHPDVVGQCVMAGAFIEELVKPTVVSDVQLSRQDGKWLARAATNATVDQIHQEDAVLAFSITASALPWVLPEDAAEGVKFARLSRFTSETLSVRGLNPGRYALKIDGHEVGQWDDEAWAAGIVLQDNPMTPEHQQSARVAQLNKERNDTFERPLRTEFQNFKTKRQNVAKAAYEKSPHLEELKTQLDLAHADLLKTMKEMRDKAKAIEDQIYAANQPKPHRYEIAPAK